MGIIELANRHKAEKEFIICQSAERNGAFNVNLMSAHFANSLMT